MKEIHFYLDVVFDYKFKTASPDSVCCSCYDSTELAIDATGKNIY